MFVLIKKERYGSQFKVHGIVEKKEDADRWRDWADGDYIPVDMSAPILCNKPLDTQDEIDREAEENKKSTFLVTGFETVNVAKEA